MKWTENMRKDAGDVLMIDLLFRLTRHSSSLTRLDLLSRVRCVHLSICKLLLPVFNHVLLLRVRLFLFPPASYTLK